MKKYPSMFGVLAALLLVASFIVPSHLITPSSVEADPGLCKWDALTTPGMLVGKYDIGYSATTLTGSEIIDMAVAGDNNRVALVARTNTYAAPVPAAPPTANILLVSTNNGISFSAAAWANWRVEFSRLAAPNAWAGHNIYLVAFAPDNPNVMAIVTDPLGGLATVGAGPKEVWITTNGGGKWEVTNLATMSGMATEFVRCIDISIDYGGRRDIAVGTVDGTGAGDVYVLRSTGFGGWVDQGFDSPAAIGDFFALRFSPTYSSDGSLAVVYANANATYYNISLRDIDRGTHSGWAFPLPGIEVKDPSSVGNSSPGFSQLNRADLELPSDFSGQAASLRRAYISLDAYGSKAAGSCEDGIYRIDNDTVYELMDTTNTPNKAIYSIAYYGTFASGKLLAGERMGDPCTATVPTWFTDAPTTCPIPCWYPALKPTTGAANQGCTPPTNGGALVGWRADGQIAFAATGSRLQVPPANWFANLILAPIPLDESAFAISRNNGETWNQTAMIDTRIFRFSDVAPTPDCKTIYLASTSSNTTETGANCAAFDSVWRTSANAEVVAPYPALSVGTFWERVLTRPTALTCNDNQTNVALLRLVPYCQDESGQIVAWAAQGTRAAMWSPDYGDYWAVITPRNAVQDFTFESKTVLYFLSSTGLVQKMPYTGTAWATTLPDVNSYIVVAHTIAAYPEGKVLVGAAYSYHAASYAAALSQNMNTDNPSFLVLSALLQSPARGNVHVAFHPNFKDNKTFYLADDNAYTAGAGSVYRATPGPLGLGDRRLADSDMMAAENGAVGCNAPHPVGQYGIVLSFTGEALYSAHTSAQGVLCGVDRTIDDGTGKFGPLSGMPKPGIAWDCLNVFVSPPAGRNPCFTLEPSSLKICGCCTPDSDSTLYAIDNAAYCPNWLFCSPSTPEGFVWAFTDCMAKKGPKLVTEDKALIGCDPVSGRAGEVNLCWEQLCVADAYDIEIAKDKDFSLIVVDMSRENACWAVMPVDVTKPCVFFPAGGQTASDTRWIGPEGKKGTVTTVVEGSAIGIAGQLECGHTYYWRVKVRECATGQWIRSPWSEVRSFSVKAGVPVSAPFQGIQPFAPANGATNVSIKNPGFSWAPMGDTTKYEFILAEDAAMTKVVKQETVSGTAYAYTGNLKYSTNYFWKVRPVEPAPGDWSPVFVFTTEPEPTPPPPPAKPAPTPLWVWVVIAIGAILVIVTLVLIFKTRRV